MRRCPESACQYSRAAENTHRVEATARIIELGQQELAFGEKIAVVTYEFDAGGEPHRDHDRVLRQIANRWQRGDVIRILYIPDDDDSMVISTR